MTTAALRDVEVDYARGLALGPLSLEVADGETVALVGPSGCGKSTALRLLAGLEAPTRGRVDRAAGRGETAVVFQAPTLAPWLTARANVALPLELAGTPAAEAATRATEALGRMGLGRPRSPPWTRSRAASWPTTSWPCRPTAARPWCSSPTMSRRPSTWLPAWWC